MPFLLNEHSSFEEHAYYVFNEYLQNPKYIKALMLIYDAYEKHYGKMFKGADFIVRHGSMHVSRVAINMVIFANLYREWGDRAALSLTDEDIKMMKIVALYHDLGRIILENDLENDSEEAEQISFGHCYLHLLASFPRADRNKLLLMARSILDKEKGENIYQRLLQNADCLEVLRADEHKWTFDKKYLTFFKEYKNNKEAMSQLNAIIDDSKRWLNLQGDAIQDAQSEVDNQQTIKGQFSLSEKAKYEKNPHCFKLVEEKLKGFPSLEKFYHPLTQKNVIHFS